MNSFCNVRKANECTNIKGITNGIINYAMYCTKKVTICVVHTINNTFDILKRNGNYHIFKLMIKVCLTIELL